MAMIPLEMLTGRLYQHKLGTGSINGKGKKLQSQPVTIPPSSQKDLITIYSLGRFMKGFSMVLSVLS